MSHSEVIGSLHVSVTSDLVLPSSSVLFAQKRPGLRCQQRIPPSAPHVSRRKVAATWRGDAARFLPRHWISTHLDSTDSAGIPENTTSASVGGRSKGGPRHLEGGTPKSHVNVVTNTGKLESC